MSAAMISVTFRCGWCRAVETRMEQAKVVDGYPFPDMSLTRICSKCASEVRHGETR